MPAEPILTIDRISKRFGGLSVIEGRLLRGWRPAAALP